MSNAKKCDMEPNHRVFFSDYPDTFKDAAPRPDCAICWANALVLVTIKHTPKAHQEAMLREIYNALGDIAARCIPVPTKAAS